MPEPDVFYLSIVSVSAVLLGICVTVRNNAFATILRHLDEEIKLGNRDFDPILEHSAYGAMASGLFFSLTIILAYIAVFISPREILGGNWFLSVVIGFGLGLLSLVYSLFAGYIKLEWPFRSPSKTSRDERPEFKDEE